MSGRDKPRGLKDASCEMQTCGRGYKRDRRRRACVYAWFAIPISSVPQWTPFLHGVEFLRWCVCSGVRVFCANVMPDAGNVLIAAGRLRSSCNLGVQIGRRCRSLNVFNILRGYRIWDWGPRDYDITQTRNTHTQLALHLRNPSWKLAQQTKSICWWYFDTLIYKVDIAWRIMILPIH